MQEDDETSAMQLYTLLRSKGIRISRRTVLRCRTSLGWTFRGSAYCQMIQTANKEKRLLFARTFLTDDFENIVFTDESTIQLSSHRRFCCRKVDAPPKLKPRSVQTTSVLRYILVLLTCVYVYTTCVTVYTNWISFCFLLRPKHPTKVHVWAGISLQGPTPICIFEGIMRKELYVDILREALLPFLNTTFALPSTHRFMQDNDPKHVSRYAQDFMASNGVNWWRTPAELPDLNPIENLWHELKEYIRRETKPKTKEELVAGIQDFWATVDTAKCTKYIRHLRKVIPRVIQLEGRATGY